ncbi:MAG TPA: hypothetical protein VF226_16275 [Hyphomicrobiaceae bacterium]
MDKKASRRRHRAFELVSRKIDGAGSRRSDDLDVPLTLGTGKGEAIALRDAHDGGSSTANSVPASRTKHAWAA